MGQINNILNSNEGCDIFIETGLGKGTSLKYAIENLNFKSYYSVDIDERLVNAFDINALQTDAEVKIFNAKSTDFLNEILEKINQDYPNEKILFWLDAHFPNADFFTKQYIQDSEDPVNFPLLHELEIISRLRKGCNDVIVCDDFRLLEPINGRKVFTAKTWIYHGTEKIKKLFPNHKLETYTHNEGYLVLKPNVVL